MLFIFGEGIECVCTCDYGVFFEGGEEHVLSFGLNIRALPIKGCLKRGAIDSDRENIEGHSGKEKYNILISILKV